MFLCVFTIYAFTLQQRMPDNPFVKVSTKKLSDLTFIHSYRWHSQDRTIIVTIENHDKHAPLDYIAF